MLKFALAIVMILTILFPAFAEDSEKININEATAEELTDLPGIGPSKAKAIVVHREAHGPFEKITDLLHVRGIGEKTLARIASWITIGEKKTEPSARVIRPKLNLATTWARIKTGR